MAAIDYAKYYDLDGYLFHEVSRRYTTEKTLSTFDFFCIVIWKANRSKSKIASRLLAQDYSDLDAAVNALVREIAATKDSKARLAVVIEKWGFRLPMASAILAVLYPDEFTVYDIRVCNVLGDFRDAQYKTKFDALWSRYTQYVESVKENAPEQLSLREKDRYLWGKSYAKQLTSDIHNRFGNTADDSDFEV